MSERSLFVIYATDANGVEDRRKELYDTHQAYLSSSDIGVSIVMSGPLVRDEKPIGSLFIVEADNKETVQTFNQNDPFATGQVWEKVIINQFIRRR